MPVLVVQANAFNRTHIATILVVVITTNERLGTLPGNVPIPPRCTGLKQPSVANVLQVLTADRSFLRERIGRVSPETMARVDSGLRLVLGVTRKRTWMPPGMTTHGRGARQTSSGMAVRRT